MLDNQHLLQLQLELNNVLLGHNHRDSFGAALAQVLNKVVPCERFMLRISNDPTQLGYRIPLVRNENGSFEKYEDVIIMERFRTEKKTLRESADAVMNNPGIYQGEFFKMLIAQFPVFAEAAEKYNINSMMALSFESIENSTCLLLLSNKADESFDEKQYELMQLLMPQIKVAFDNLIRYEKLKQEEEKRKMQLDLNNVLLMHTNRDDFGMALARLVNKVVPCERFTLRIWSGPLDLGYRLPLVRKEDDSYERYSDRFMVEQIQASPEKVMQAFQFISEAPGIYQGKDFEEMCLKFPGLGLASKTFDIHSVMTLSFKTIDFNCLVVLGNTATISFEDRQYDMMQLLMPQIILAFVNLFKYEKMKEEERESKTQLAIMTRFTSQGELEELATAAIHDVNEFISFDYWCFISKMQPSSRMAFRMALKPNQFRDIYGEQFFETIKHPPISPDDFFERHPELLERPFLFVGEDFEALLSKDTFFAACNQNIQLQSAITIPVMAYGKTEAITILGSTRKYAYMDDDLEAITRIMPYMSMCHQQYHSMLRIQNLTKQLELEKNYLVEEIKSNFNFDEIIAGGPLMQEVFRQMSKVAPTDSTVLVLGETGTGKELIARGIHNQSPRKDKVLVKVNCASLPAQLIESELFGHEKGSFTGAIDRRIGKFELANEGTIFLDEIGEMPLELQAKLLRVLQEREIERIGGKTVIKLDVRVIAATNRDLESEVEAGKFRRDLFYRLNVFPIHLPALRDRKEDIPLLAKHFLEKFTKKFGKPFKGVKRDLIEELMAYNWPGNIREMENVLEHSVIVGEESGLKLKRSTQPVSQNQQYAPPAAKQETRKEPIVHATISDDEIMRVLSQTKGKIVGPMGAAQVLKLRPAQIEEVERKRLIETLKKTNGKIRGEDGAANLLGLNATTLEARLKKLGIERKQEFG